MSTNEQENMEVTLTADSSLEAHVRKETKMEVWMFPAGKCQCRAAPPSRSIRTQLFWRCHAVTAVDSVTILRRKARKKRWATQTIPSTLPLEMFDVCSPRPPAPQPPSPLVPTERQQIMPPRARPHPGTPDCYKRIRTNSLPPNISTV